VFTLPFACSLHSLFLLLGLDYRLCSVPGLNDVVSSARESIAISLGLLDTAYVFAERSVDLANDIAIQSAEFVKDFNTGVCPKLQGQLCESLDNFETCRVEEVFGGDFIFNAIIRHFSSNNTVVLDQTEQALGLIEDIQTSLQNSDDLLNNVDWLFNVSAFLSILLACLCLTVVVSLILQLRGRELPKRVRLWAYRFFLGVFVFLVSFSFIFAIAFVITSTTMADVCVGDPDERLKSVLQVQLSTMRPFTRELAQYAIDRKYSTTLYDETNDAMDVDVTILDTYSHTLFVCSFLMMAECQKPPASKVQDFLVEGSNYLVDLSFPVDNSTNRYEEVCGEIDVDRWATAANTVGARLCNVSDAIADVRELFKCETWYPLYVSTVHDTLCYHVDAYAWIAFTQFFVVCLAMVIVTCRVAIYQGIEVLEDTTALVEEGKGDDDGQQTSVMVPAQQQEESSTVPPGDDGAPADSGLDLAVSTEDSA
jgi:hypothetical protein